MTKKPWQTSLQKLIHQQRQCLNPDRPLSKSERQRFALASDLPLERTYIYGPRLVRSFLGETVTPVQKDPNRPLARCQIKQLMSQMSMSEQSVKALEPQHARQHLIHPLVYHV